MNTFITKLKILFGDKALMKRVLFVLGALVLFRLLAAIPVPGVDSAQLSRFLSNNQFLGVLNIFSGGGLSSLSIVMLGVGPFITGSIIMQLLTIMVPRFKALYHEEGEAGRRKFTSYSRMLTVPLAIVQGYALLTILQKQAVLGSISLFGMVTSISVIVAGSLLMMWIGELVTEFGLGNGVSIIIFAGIVSQLPQKIGQLLFTFDPSQIPVYVGFLVVALLVILGVVIIMEAERPIPVTYARQVHGSHTTGGVSTYIPLRLNQAGVMPIIFALSILLFPQIVSNFLSGTSVVALQKIAEFMAYITNTQWLYAVLYFLLVFLFTYFYTAITFDPEALATNLQKSGAFVPGIRPGNSTAVHVATILGHTTFIGAFFLGIIAVLPLIMQSITGITTLALGGTALLIVVSVVVDLIKKLDAQLTMREY